VLLGANAGLRRGEIIALEQADADYRRGQLSVARFDCCGVVGSPEGGKTRRIPMTKRLAEALSAIRHLRGFRVLYQRDGELVTETTLRSSMEGAERAGGRKRHVQMGSVPTEIRTLDRSSISTPRRCTPNALVALG
jgi:integrase